VRINRDLVILHGAVDEILYRSEIGYGGLKCAERAVVANVHVLPSELDVVVPALITHGRVALIEVLRPAEGNRRSQRAGRRKIPGQHSVAVGLAADHVTDEKGRRDRRGAEWLVGEQTVVDEARFGNQLRRPGVSQL